MQRSVIALGVLVMALVPVFMANAAIFSTVDQVVSFGTRVAEMVYVIALAIGIIFTLMAAMKYITANGDSAKVGEAHKALLYAVIGIAVAIVSFGVPNIIKDILTRR